MSQNGITLPYFWMQRYQVVTLFPVIWMDSSSTCHSFSSTSWAYSRNWLCCPRMFCYHLLALEILKLFLKSFQWDFTTVMSGYYDSIRCISFSFSLQIGWMHLSFLSYPQMCRLPAATVRSTICCSSDSPSSASWSQKKKSSDHAPCFYAKNSTYR